MKYFDEMRALLLERLDTDRELEEREIREGIDELLLSCGRRPLTLKERRSWDGSCSIPSGDWMCCRNWRMIRKSRRLW